VPVSPISPVETSAVLGGRAAGLHERRVDKFDVDAAVLHCLGGMGDLHQLARGCIRIGERAGGDELHDLLCCQSAALHLRPGGRMARTQTASFVQIKL